MANKTVAELQAEFDKVSAETQKAYDVLHPTFGSDARQIAYEYEKAVKEKDAKTIAELKPAYDAAQAKYADAQTRKNALRKELEAVKKEESAAKTKSISSKAAANVYDKALKDLAVAEAKLGGYKGQDNYITAYKNAQSAYDAAVKAGKNPVALPEAKVPIIISAGAGGEQGGGGQKTPEKPLNEWIDFLANPENKTILSKAQKDLAKNFGYKGPTDGTWSVDFQNTLGKVAGARQVLPEAVKPAGTILDFIANPTVDLGFGTSAAGAAAPKITDYPVVSSLTDAKKAINEVFQTSLKRDATAAEVKLLYPLLKKAQLDNPTSYKTENVNGKNAKVQYSGLDTGQWILDQLTANKDLNLKSELEKVKTEAPDLVKRQADKKIYDNLVAQAAGDPAKLQAALDTTAYGRGLKEFQASLASSALSKGLTNTADELNTVAKELYDQGVAANSQVALDAISKKAKYGVGKEGHYTGTAGTTFDDLQKTAAANGLDLNKTFGSNINDWIAAVDKGESVDTFKRIIRDTAKIGMPEKVAKLLDQGVDLQTIYTPYKNLMASTLEINPQTITLNDPTLRAAITADKEVPLYEFERQLRKDNRWQYTNQAKSEVGDATQRILKDFGFMG